jgi:hypothetical protein
MLSGFPLRLALATLNHRSNIYRALVINPAQRSTSIAIASTRAISKRRPAAP